MNAVFDKDFIKQILKNRNMNYIELSNLSGIPLSTIRQIFATKNQRNPSLDTLQAIFNVLELSTNTQNNKSDNSRILSIYNQLSDYSKDMLISYATYMLENEKGNKIPSFIKMPKNSQLEENKD